MIFKEDFLSEYFGLLQSDADEVNCCVISLKDYKYAIDAVKLNFYLAVLCSRGECNVTVGHHDFSISSSTISIIPPQTLFSIKNFSEPFVADFLFFKSDFVKTGFVKSEVMEELLLINPDYPPIFDLEETKFQDFSYKIAKIKVETENQSPFCLEVSRLYILQLLYDYNRVCEMCLLNSDKLINRQYQIMYTFRKLVDKNFHQYKTVKEYADLMYLSSKYLSECVKNQTGVSALALIRNRIMLEAELLLKYSTLSVKNISDKLGFTSTSSFSRFFKAAKGVSPIHYHKKPKN